MFRLWAPVGASISPCGSGSGASEREDWAANNGRLAGAFALTGRRCLFCSHERARDESSGAAEGAIVLRAQVLRARLRFGFEFGPKSDSDSDLDELGGFVWAQFRLHRWNHNLMLILVASSPLVGCNSLSWPRLSVGLSAARIGLRRLNFSQTKRAVSFRAQTRPCLQDSPLAHD